LAAAQASREASHRRSSPAVKQLAQPELADPNAATAVTDLDRGHAKRCHPPMARFSLGHRQGGPVERATAWRRIEAACESCGQPLMGRTVTTELTESSTPIRVETQTRCRNDECTEN